MAWQKGKPRKKKKEVKQKEAFQDNMASHVVHRFSTTNSLSWFLFPQLLKRTEEFCNKHQTDLTADIMLPMVKASFVSEDQGSLFYGVLEGMNLIGHMIAKRATDLPRPYILIYHGDMDIVDQKATQKIMDEVVDFAKANKCPTIKIVTHRNPEGFERRYGFIHKQSIMEKPVDLTPKTEPPKKE